MKIVQAAHWYYPDTVGGIEVYVAGLSKRLRMAGHEVFIAAPHTQNNQERNYEYEGFSVYRYPIPPKPSREETQGVIPVRGTEYFHAWLNKIQPDIVHFHGLSMGAGILEIQAAQLAGAKIVFTSHLGTVGSLCRSPTLMYMGKDICDGIIRSDKCTVCVLEQRHVPSILGRMISRFPLCLGRMLRGIPFGLGTVLAMNYLMSIEQDAYFRLPLLVDKFVVLTQADYNMMISRGFHRSNIFINRLGITSEAIARKPVPQESPTKKPVKIGYLGRFELIKGIYDLAKAVASLSADIHFGLEFRGPAITYSQKNNLNRIKAITGRDPRVSFAPAVSHEEVFDVLKSYDVICCPSLCFEGGPTVALEAYAVGTPVIGTKIGGLAEIITDKVSGRLVKPGDCRVLAEIIKEVSVNPEGTIDQWRRNIPFVRTMDEIAKDYCKIYES